MPRLIEKPTTISAAGNKPKRIEEFIGCLNTDHQNISIARMISPAGWQEPAQQPEFEEFTVVLEGTLCVETDGQTIQVNAGQAVITHPGEKVRYCTPNGAQYIAICLPAFTPQTVHRSEEE